MCKSAQLHVSLGTLFQDLSVGLSKTMKIAQCLPEYVSVAAALILHLMSCLLAGWFWCTVHYHGHRRGREQTRHLPPSFRLFKKTKLIKAGIVPNIM
jgi:hypothetical protein